MTQSLPIVHLNGTSRQELLAQQVAVLDALQTALDALRDAAPHGRDYYPSPNPEAFHIALDEHRLRVEKIASVHNDFTIIADQLANPV